MKRLNTPNNGVAEGSASTKIAILAFPKRQFLLTAPDHATISESPLYQNPYWPTATDQSAEK